MGHEKGKKFFSSYEGDEIDALLGAMAQANPLPSGTDWVAFIDDCRAAQDAAEAAAASVAGAEETCAQSAASASDSANAAHEDADRAEEAAAHVDLPVKRGEGYNSALVGDVDNNIASADYSYAEGRITGATGIAAHAEGEMNYSAGDYSHTEGFNNRAQENCSHAEGAGNRATGRNSHVEGDGNIANHLDQHVFGEYNVIDTNPRDAMYRGDFIEIVGNGSSDNNRSNARSLDWGGNEILAGKLTMGKLPTGAMDAVPPCLVTNPNLLDNAYLIGGGTDGAFPINQRGQTQYSNAGNIFDRWAIGSGAAISLDSDGVSISGGMGQYNEMYKLTAGETYTLSALLKDDNGTTLWSESGELANSTAWQIVSGTANANGIAIRLSSSRWHVAIWNNVANRKVLAVKLEKGSVQTLAHQESGEWALNDPAPNYAMELLKCQRYLYKYEGLTTAAALAGSSVTAITIPFPVTMRAAPANAGITGVTYFDSKTASGYQGYKTGVRFYNGSSVSFSVTGFLASAEL